MAVARDVPVPMTDLEYVAIPTPPARPNHRAVTNGANRRSAGRSVVGAGMATHRAKYWMLPQTEDARDAAELERCAKEGSAHRFPTLIEVVATVGAIRVPNGVDHGAREREGRGE